MSTSSSRFRRRQILKISVVLFVLFGLAWIRRRFETSVPSQYEPIRIPKTISGNVPRPHYLPIVYVNESRGPSANHNRPLIPHIIHQIWKSYKVPQSLASLVKTWRTKHPEWQYWYWTDADSRRFVQLRYPKYYEMFRKYTLNIHRAEAIRYFILHTFGGVYADMDMEVLKPLDDLTYKHHCIVSQEPRGHSRIIWHRQRLACNALMAARPRHPFFDWIIKKLPDRDRLTGKHELMAKTGPIMVDISVTEYLERGKGRAYNQSQTMYLAEPELFLPSISANEMAVIKKKCRHRQRTMARQATCDQLFAQKFANSIPKKAYTNHMWEHTYKRAGINTGGIDIFKLIPDATNVKTMLDEMEKNEAVT